MTPIAWIVFGLFGFVWLVVVIAICRTASRAERLAEQLDAEWQAEFGLANDDCPEDESWHAETLDGRDWRDI